MGTGGDDTDKLVVLDGVLLDVVLLDEVRPDPHRGADDARLLVGLQPLERVVQIRLDPEAVLHQDVRRLRMCTGVGGGEQGRQ